MIYGRQEIQKQIQTQRQMQEKPTDLYVFGKEMTKRV